MGCTSSTQVETDPVTGKQRQKHKLGGAYPGNRRTPNNVHTPAASEFNSQGQATAHFVNYGGGNALVLQQNGIAQPQAGEAIPGGKTPEYIQVTLPSGVNGGDTIHVRAPDGRLNEIVVPSGFGPGSTFTVEFADGQPPTSAPTRTPAPYSAPVAPARASTTNHNNGGDDGFATGFQNPGFVPMAPAASATSYGIERDFDLSAYPAAADAQPVYSTPPTYQSSPY